MAKVTSKSRSSGDKPVRQTRGPGMNLGLKKPRFGKFPKSEDTSAKKSSGGGSSRLQKGPKMEYLPGSGFPTAGRRKK
jgi:hypothetical protein